MTAASGYFRPNLALANATLAAMARRAGNAGRQHGLVQVRGEIRHGVSAAALRAQLDQLRHAASLRLLLDSEGGNVDEAFRMYALLREHGAAVSAAITGQCSSAAIVILLAADHRHLKSGGRLMIHNAAIARSDLRRRLTARYVRDIADLIARADGRIVDLLVERTGFDRAFFVRAMRNGEAMRPIDALACGLVHEVDGCVASRPCDRRWPATVRQIANSGCIIGLPSHLFSDNYLAACRAAPARIA